VKFVIAPDKFKGSLSGTQFCDAVQEGLLAVIPDAEIMKVPLADGGDGTISVLEAQLPGSRREVLVWDPLMRNIKSSYLFDQATGRAYVEMASASGMRLLHQNDQNCYHTTSFGTGQLIADALDRGAKQVILGIGGSATTDCGVGMAAALGYRFLDKEGRELIPIGKNLIEIEYIVEEQVDPRIAEVEFLVACDVTNPLYGPEGAAYVYGPQKGASDKEVELLDLGLRHMASLIRSHFGFEVHQLSGAGAAGGMGAGAITFLKAELSSGVELVKQMIGFDEKVKGADWIITGEGKLDSQTLSGKTILGVLSSAHVNGCSLAALCGMISMSDARKELEIDYADSVMARASDLQDAMENSARYVREMASDFARALTLSE
jgi:glycerate kinase